MGNRRAKEKKLKEFIHENMAAIDADIRKELDSQFEKITKTDREDFVYANEYWNMLAVRENVKL